MAYERQFHISLVGENAADVDSDPLYVGLGRVSVQTAGPAANNTILQGNDQENFRTAVMNDVSETSLASVDTGLYELRDRAKFLLLRVESGGVEGALHEFIVTVYDED